MENDSNFRVGQSVVTICEVSAALGHIDYGRIPEGATGAVIGFSPSGRAIFRFPGHGVHSFAEPHLFVVVSQSPFSPDRAKTRVNERLSVLQRIIAIAFDHTLTTTERIERIKTEVQL